MNFETGAYIRSITATQGRWAVWKDVARRVNGEPSRLADAMKMRLESKLAPERTFAMDPFFKEVLKNAVDAIDYDEAARQVLALSEEEGAE